MNPSFVNTLSEEVIYSSAKMELSIVHKRILRITLRGFQQLSEAVRDHTLISQALKDHKVNLLMVDQRLLKVLSEDLKVFFVQAIQETSQNGIRKIAVLQPENIFARSSMSSVESQSSPHKAYQRKHFSDETEAIYWLLER